MKPWVSASIAEPAMVGDLLHILREIGFFIETAQTCSSEQLLIYGCEPALLISDQTQYTQLEAFIAAWPGIPVLWMTADDAGYPSQERITRFKSAVPPVSELFVLIYNRLPAQEIQAEVLIGDWIEFQISSRAEVFYSTRKLFRQLLEYSLLDKTSLYQIHHSICEVLINAMEHGNEYDASKQVHCSWVLFKDRLIVKMVDQGSGFLVSQLPDTLENPHEEADKRNRQGKRPGGYGLALVRKWMDLQVSDRGNTVILTKIFET